MPGRSPTRSRTAPPPRTSSACSAPSPPRSAGRRSWPRRPRSCSPSASRCPTAPSRRPAMPLMRRRPLLRAAAVGGGAYLAGKQRARGQEREYEQDQRLGQLEGQQSAAAPPPAPAAPAPAGPTADTIERLKQLGQLHEQGVLTDAEFQGQKAQLLGG